VLAPLRRTGHACSVITAGQSTRADLAHRITVRVWTFGLVANTVGAFVVLAFLVFLFPIKLPDQEFEAVLRAGLPALGIYLLVSLPLGAVVMDSRLRRVRRWLRSGHSATAVERLLVLRHPRFSTMVTFALWLGGALTFAVVLSDARPVLVWGGMETIALGGLTSCALQYLVLERMLRPIAALALANGTPPERPLLGVAARLKITWALSTGIPLFGITAFGVNGVLGTRYDVERIVAASLALAVLGLLVGFAATAFAARAVADPLVAMREAVGSVQDGDLTARVQVDDASEIGLLEAGFNRMTAGLAERERLRQAFGTFVDPALAERVLSEGTDLAGEDVEVSLLFLDIRGFTAFAERSEARAVVAMLNGLFDAVVPVILQHGGHANKFIGDGLLAVFGAPERHEDHADRAVAAALEVAALVRERYQGEVRVGIGVNTGKVVVGTIGGGGRLDFTVIGDAVNTAARVEAATRQTGDDVLITDETRSQLAGGRDGWVERPAVPLKGKRTAVRLFAPS
jgi:adenylate cyclase